jgi:hypothetical protein
MVEHFHVLPYEGGLFDQPAGVMFKIEAVLRADTSSERDKNKAEAEDKVEARVAAMKGAKVT